MRPRRDCPEHSPSGVWASSAAQPRRSWARSTQASELRFEHLTASSSKNAPRAGGPCGSRSSSRSCRSLSAFSICSREDGDMASRFARPLRACERGCSSGSWAGVLLWVGGADRSPADRGCAPATPELVVHRAIRTSRESPCSPLRSSWAGWLLRRPLVPLAQPSAEERLAGYTCALAWLGVVALVVALTKPFALVFVLPSLYAWLWLPLQAQFWQRVGIYAIGLARPDRRDFSCSDGSLGSGRPTPPSTSPGSRPWATSRSSLCCSRSRG